jgi:hypothetical protein
MRDMLLSMIVLAVVVLALTALTRSCSFSPGGPTVSHSTLPTVDVSAELGAAAGQVAFPVRQPAVPAGWVSNSASVQQIGADHTHTEVSVGWLTEARRFVQLDQSNASVTDLVDQVSGLSGAVTVQGAITVAGQTWTIYRGVRDEQSWARDLGPVRLLITGNGTPAEFTTMAAAAQTAKVREPSS